MNPLRMTLAAAIAIVITACNSDTPPDARAQADAQAAAAVNAAKEAAAAKANDPVANMARAVGNGKPGAAAAIHYDILSKPRAGTPVEIELVVVPNDGVDSFSAKITGMEGVTLSGDLTLKVDKVEAKKPYKHRFTVLAPQSGVFYVTVAVDTQLGGATMGRTFSIPFAVGDGARPQKIAAPPTVKDANGQAIQQLPAAEPKK